MGTIFIGVGVFVAACVAGAWSLARQAPRIRRLLRKTVRTEVASAPEFRPIAFVGRIEYATRTLTAPLTARSCAAYHVDVIDDDGSVVVTPRVSQHDVVDFVVRDGAGGKALVRVGGGRNVQLYLEKNVIQKSSRRLELATEMMRGLLARAGPSHLDRPFAAHLVIEHVLCEKDDVLVAGVGHWEGDTAVEAGYRESPRVLVVEPDVGFPLVIADDVDLIHDSLQHKRRR